MKRNKLLLVPILTLLITSSLASMSSILPLAKATYVEGTISQNTEWTLVDNPFIVSNNITIADGATLTIEPGVNVRFGGDFQITVNGRIIADGTANRPITFMYNGLNASTEDWITIQINGTQDSSLTYCTIEHGSNAVTLEQGSLNLQNNLIISNSNGTVLNGGNAVIENNEIINNTINGIIITGDGQATVHNNLISTNTNGIRLTGNLTGSTSITQNNITLNSQDGIQLAADAYQDTTIQQNNVSLNGYGFHAVTATSPTITHNSISNNTEGIFYEIGTGHEAHFNNIYNNTAGIDVNMDVLDMSLIVTVNATYNYWGSETGPFHKSLNPNGKGNGVGGDGANIDFIFFLSAPIDYANAAPTAVLKTDKTIVAPNEPVTFIGTYSSDDRRVDQYFFNFGDGENSGWTTLTLFNHTYSTIQNYTASLTVIDDFAVASQNTATTNIAIMDLTPLTVSLSLSNEVADYNGNVTVTVQVQDASVPVQNAAVTLLSLEGGTFSQMSGETDADGNFETTFTAPSVQDTADVRLIAMASATGYADGSSHTYLKVLPLLHVHTITEPLTVKSEATAAITFYASGGLGQPVANASLTVTVGAGTLQTNTGVTGPDGTATFFFTAPLTLVPMDITTTSTAQKPGFTDGHDQETISVLQNVLTVEVIPDSQQTLSERNTTVTVLVTCDNIPTPNANVTVSSDNGNCASTNGTTGSDGTTTFLFTALQTTTAINTTLTATATKPHYVDGTNQTIINVNPKTLNLQMTAQNSLATSETKIALTVKVTYDSAPVQNASVTVTAQNGNFSQPNATTDARGSATFIFNTPLVNTPQNIIITAEASKTGYANGQDSLTINATPGNISLQIVANSYLILSGANTILNVTATSNSTLVEGAQIAITADTGDFFPRTQFTDTNGTCSFTYNAPLTTVQLHIIIDVNATKNGYNPTQNQTSINVLPIEPIHNQQGFPTLTLILVILIPVIIAAVAAILIKLKLLVVSTGESSDE